MLTAIRTHDGDPTFVLHATETAPEPNQLAALLARTPSQSLFLTTAAAAVFPGTSNSVAEGDIPAFATLADVRGIVVSVQALIAHCEMKSDVLHLAPVQTAPPEDSPRNDSSPPQEVSLDPFAFLRRCPDWFLDLPVTAVAVPTRLANRLSQKLRHDGADTTLRDVSAFRLQDVMSWSGIGRKSLSDFANVIVTAVQPGALAPTDPSAERPEISLSDAIIPLDGTQHPPEITSLRCGIEAWVEELPHTLRTVLQLRYPPPGTRQATLQQLGETLGFTRERARQLEGSLLRRTVHRAPWLRTTITRLAAKLNVREAPVNLLTIEREDSWFAGTAHYSSYIGRAVQLATDDALQMLEVGGGRFISRCSAERYELLRENTKQSLIEMSTVTTPLDEVRRRITALATDAHAPELVDVVLNEWFSSLHFVHSSQSASPLLVGFGRSIATLVSAVLHEAEQPLHVSEIAARVHLISGRDVLPAQASNVMDKIGAVQFDRGTWGLRSHVPGTEEQHEQIREFLEELILEQCDQQHHCEQMLSELLESDLDVPEGFTKYSVKAVLSLSQKVADLGRLSFAADVASSTADRLHISDVAVQVLESAGKPLSFREVRQRIASVRGLNSTFMLQPDERLARTRTGVWGLLERDFFTTFEEQDAVRATFYAELHRRGASVHESELIHVLSASGITTPTELTSFMVGSILTSDTRFRAWEGRLVGLSGWEDPGRLSAVNAARELVHLEDRPARVEVLLEMLEPLAERELSLDEAKTALRAAGYTWDSESALWYPPAQQSDDEDDDKELAQ